MTPKATKFFCVFLCSIFFWATVQPGISSGASNDICQNPVTVADLKQIYPQARFHYVRIGGAKVLMAQVSTDQDQIPNPSSSPQKIGAQTYSASQLCQKYPELIGMFHRIDLDHPYIKKAVSNHKTLIVLYTDKINTHNIKGDPPFTALAQLYPDCRFYMYSIDSESKFDQVKQVIDPSGIVYAAQVASVAENSTQLKTPGSLQDNQNDTENRDDQDNYPPQDVSVTVHESCMHSVPDFGDNEAAVVVFIIVGVFVAAVLIVYAGKYVYDAVKKGTRYQYWWEATLPLTFYAKEQNNRFKEYGTISGIRIVSGIVDHPVQIGLAAEAGWMSSTLETETQNQKDKKSVSGVYGMIGPAVRLILSDAPTEPNPTCLTLEVLAGAADNLESGLISSARAGIVFGIQRHWRIGAHIGSLYFNLDEKQGIAQEHDNFRLTFGLEMGYRF